MNDEDQIDFFANQELTNRTPVLYVPTDGPPRIEERIVIDNRFDESLDRSVLVPKTTKHETVTYREDGTIIVNGP